MSRLVIVIGLLALLVGLGSAVYGVWTIWDQHRVITSARPTKAKVTEHATKDLKGGGFVAKVPLVTYEYTVDQQPYTSNTVTPAELMLPNTWAETVFQQFPIGAEVEAYHDPQDPSQAFLIPKYSVKPYLPLLVGLVIAAMGLGVVAEQWLSNDEPPAYTATAAPLTLIAKQHHLTRARVLGIVGLIGLVCGMPAVVHHLLMSTAPHERMGFLFDGAFGIAVLVVLVLSILGFRQGGGFGTPVVTLDRSPVVGEPLQLRASVPTRFRGTASLQACLKCEAKDTRLFNFSEETPDTVLVEQRVALALSQATTSEGEIGGSAALTVPPVAPPSTPADSPEQPHFVWTLLLTAEGNGGRKAETEYLLAVAPSPQADQPPAAAGQG
jgi:hypothetical protein